MVLLENLKVGTRVQTNWNGSILKGTVRYTGGLITRQGDWVGVELDEPVGNSSGLFKGRRYFQCNAKHGIFIQPRRLHLLGNWRTMSANRYRTIHRESFTDETLFSKKTEALKAISWQDPVVISSDYMASTKVGFKAPFVDSLTSNIRLNPKTSFHKQHLVGHRLPSAKSSRDTNSCDSGRISRRSSKQQDLFVPSSPSIPNIHVPRPVLKRMVRTQHFGTSLPRYSTLY